VEPGSWQVESGFEPYGGRGFVPEFVLQPRLGLGKRAEAFWTARVARAGSVWRFRTLAFSPKVQLLKRQTWQVALVGWGYALLDAWKARGEVSCLMDFRVTAQGVLTVNGSLQAGPGQPPTYFATAFYTQGIGSRFSTWVEAFAYGPGPTLGIGSGWQYLLGKERLAALDLALNYRTGGAFQTQIGLSKKGRLLRRPLFRS